MSLTIKFDTDNIAFEDENMGPECARILRWIAGCIERHAQGDNGATFTLSDSNGNTVGTAEFFPRDDERSWGAPNDCAECERSNGPHYAGPCDH